MPKFKPNAGIQRRGLALELTKRFLPEDEYNLAKDQGETNIAIANSYLLDLFDDVDYKLAFIRLLLPYAQKFYSSTLLLPNMRSNFVDWCIDSDKWIQFKLQHLELTNDPNDRLTKQDLADAFASTMKIQVSELTALSEGKRIGLRYEKGLRMNSRTTRSYAGMRSERGVFAGVRVFTAANTLTPTIVD
jgi:hypothetical protein